MLVKFLDGNGGVNFHLRTFRLNFRLRQNQMRRLCVDSPSKNDDKNVTNFFQIPQIS